MTAFLERRKVLSTKPILLPERLTQRNLFSMQSFAEWKDEGLCRHRITQSQRLMSSIQIENSITPRESGGSEPHGSHHILSSDNEKTKREGRFQGILFHESQRRMNHKSFTNAMGNNLAGISFDDIEALSISS